MATLDRLAPPPVSSLPAGTAWSPRRAIAAALIMAAAIAALLVFQSSGLAESGQTLQRLERERLDAAARVHRLEAEVAALSSLERVERAARGRLGMVPALDILYLDVAVSAPADPLLPRPVVQPRRALDESTRPWWRRLLSIAPFF